MKIPSAISISLGVIGTGIWGFLMLISIAFVIYDQPLSLSDENFLLYFLIKYYPVVMLCLFLLAVRLKDDNGILKFCSVALPSLIFIYLIYDMTRVSIIEWDEFETTEQTQFIYESAFGSSKNLDNLLPKVGRVNFVGKVGLSPLLAAYKGRNKDAFHFLLENGADVNLMPKNSLQYNVANYIINDFDHDKSSQKYFETLIEYGLDIHIGTEFSNLLQSAATSKNQWYLRYLIESGGNANRKGTVFLTPIGTATLHQYWENAIYLAQFSDQNGLKEAAAIFYENNENGRYWNKIAERDEFRQVLLNKGVDFRKSFEVKDAERQKRLDLIQMKHTK